MSIDRGWLLEVVQHPNWLFVCPSLGTGPVDGVNSSAVQPEGIRIAWIRGTLCMTKPMLFREWASALQFPEYFGHNWDALEECMSDLEWLPALAYVIVVTEGDSILSEDTDKANAFATLMSILRDVAAIWSERTASLSGAPAQGIPFRVAFLCWQGNYSEVLNRLQDWRPTVIGCE